MVKVSHHEIVISFTSLIIFGPISSGFSHAVRSAPDVHIAIALRAAHVAGVMVVIVATASGTIVEVATSGAAVHVRDKTIAIFAIALLTDFLSFDSHLDETLLIGSLTMFSLFIDSSDLVWLILGAMIYLNKI